MQPGKPTILFIGPTPPPYSGPELSMHLFLESELKSKYKIKYIKTNFRRDNTNKGKLDAASLFAFPVFFSRLIYSLIKYRPQVAYYPITPTQLGWIGRDALCLIICRLLRAKTIIHLRGSHLKLNFKTFHPTVQKLARFACRSVSLALVQAERLRDQFEDLVPDTQVQVLYQAIDTKKYDNDTVPSENTLDVLFMGHLTQAKGYCDLLRCIPTVAQAVPEVRFLVAGTKRRGERGVFFNQRTGKPLHYEDPDEVERTVIGGRYGANYKFLGVISGPTKLEYLRHCAIFVLPSYSEGFSRALLEAMSVGRPVICTPVGAHAEIVQDGINGYLVEPGDVSALAKRIIDLLKDVELRNKIGQVNYEYVREQFDIDRISSQFAAYIDMVINHETS